VHGFDVIFTGNPHIYIIYIYGGFTGESFINGGVSTATFDVGL
jgi:hypothetical protein